MCFVYAEDAGMLARASMQAALSGKGRLQIVRRIAEATNAAKQAPTMRAKAVKALSSSQTPAFWPCQTSSTASMALSR